MNQLKAALHFLRLVDENGQLSLTNLAAIAATINLLFCQNAGIEQVGAFVASLVSYQAKRYLSGKPATEAEEMAAIKEQIAKLQTSVTAVQLANNMKR
jgi:hypothetical protein